MGKGKRAKAPRQAGESRYGMIRMYAEIAVISIAVAWAFYDSIWGCAVSAVIYLPYRALYIDRQIRIRRREIQLNMREFLQVLITFIQTGYSLENAFIQAEQEMENLLGTTNEMVVLLREMNNKLRMNIPVERAFGEFSERLGDGESRELSEIIEVAKRLGGNYNDTIRRTAANLEDRMAVEDDISTMIAEKRLEMRIMVVMPFVIISYIKLTSSDFVKGLYHSTTGIAVMTVCLVIYAVMIIWADRITRIEV